MVAGAVAGAYIASEIKDSLEKEDQENLAAASVQAADTDTATQWENQETGIKGEAKVVANSRISARRAGLPSEECREIEQTIEKADGSVVKGNMVYCKDADGVWQVAA